MVSTFVDWLPRPPRLPRKSQPLQDGAHETMVCIVKIIVLFSNYKSRWAIQCCHSYTEWRKRSSLLAIQRYIKKCQSIPDFDSLFVKADRSSRKSQSPSPPPSASPTTPSAPPPTTNVSGMYSAAPNCSSTSSSSPSKSAVNSDKVPIEENEILKMGD